MSLPFRKAPFLSGDDNGVIVDRKESNAFVPSG